MVMKLTLLSFVLAASLVTALPREYSDVKKVAKFDQRSLKNAHDDFNVVGIEPMAKRGPDDISKPAGTVGDATKDATDAAGDAAKDVADGNVADAVGGAAKDATDAAGDAAKDVADGNVADAVEGAAKDATDAAGYGGQ
ncbi:hypothetical protein [Absidia glauca]|uniref:Uncharacterized protein n=1 Tax=Absidia glauca TaxID=4829 RepID=A0A163JYA0_ABSGL|nr:hypothetical protein [Absidia glauca]